MFFSALARLAVSGDDVRDLRARAGGGRPARARVLAARGRDARGGDDDERLRPRRVPRGFVARLVRLRRLGPPRASRALSTISF